MRSILLVMYVLFIAGILHTGLQAQEETPENYLENALDIIEARAYFSDNVADWAQVRAQAMGQIEGATAVSAGHRAITLVLHELGDGHSIFLTPGVLANLEGGSGPLPDGRRVDARIGYLNLPGVEGREARLVDYVNAAHLAIDRIRDEGEALCGWVVDLRQNQGGNMWPMLAAVGPLLGEGRLGSIEFRDGSQLDWHYENGTAELILEEAEHPDQFHVDGQFVPEPDSTEMLPVALLTGSMTASAGEFVLISFSGRENSRTFGQATFGIPTWNSEFELSDGALLILTTALVSDRDENLFEGPIEPDELIEPAFRRNQPHSDNILEGALEWLAGQGSCEEIATGD